MSIEEMELFEAECKLLCYKGNMSRSNLGSFYNNEQANWMYQMWLSSKNREGYKFVPVEPTQEMLDKFPEVLYQDTYAGECSFLVDDETLRLGYKAMIGVCDDH